MESPKFLFQSAIIKDAKFKKKRKEEGREGRKEGRVGRNNFSNDVYADKL